jgi:hypothetical protein
MNDFELHIFTLIRSLFEHEIPDSYLLNTRQIYCYKSLTQEKQTIELLASASKTFISIGFPSDFDTQVRDLISNKKASYSWSHTLPKELTKHFLSFGDILITLFLDKITVLEIEEFYKSEKKVTKTSLEKLSHILHKTGVFKMSIEFNPEKAAKIKREVLKSF